ncbi:MAG: ABC transporter ATP-binding protein [Cellulosilyticaceae bacterium]
MKTFLSNTKQQVCLIAKGVKAIHKLLPGMLIVSVGAGLLASILPFIPIYFSSLIITELSLETRSLERIIQLVSLTLVLSFGCRLLANFFNQMFDTMQYVLGHKNQLYIASKGYGLDYADMDDVKVREMREKVNRGRYSKGIMGIVFQLNTLTKHVCSVVISVALLVQMFGAKSMGTGAFEQLMNSPLTAIGIMLLLTGSVVYAVKTNAITQKKQFEMMNEAAPHYNYDRFYAYQLGAEYNWGKDIRIYNQKKLVEKRINFHLGQIVNLESVVPKMNAKYWTIGSGIQVIVNIMTYLFVGLKALAGAFGVGNIVLYTGGVTQFGEGVTGTMQTLSNIKQNNDYLRWYFDFIELPNRKESGDLPIDLEVIKSATISFRNVSFKYPGNEKESLKNISIDFNVGERVAVVGKNGSGKTTFIKLLCRLYDPTEGEILLNGINIKHYKYEDYLAAFSVVFQDFNLFSFTLGENIAVSSEYDEDRVLDCTYKAGLEKRMAQFPDGLSTQLYNEFSEEGVEISGGEAQRVAIARALYKDAPFIVLDEPTAALDPIAEADIYGRLNDLIQDKTAIYISHRLSSCCFCSHIAVFDQGELIQHDTHKALLEVEDGLYHELWNAQAQYYA